MPADLQYLRNLPDHDRVEIELRDCIRVIEEDILDEEMTDELWEKIYPLIDTDDFYEQSGGGAYTFSYDRRYDALIEIVNEVRPPKEDLPYHINVDGVIPCTNCGKPIYYIPEQSYTVGKWTHLRTRFGKCYPGEEGQPERACPESVNEDGTAWYSVTS